VYGRLFQLDSARGSMKSEPNKSRLEKLLEIEFDHLQKINDKYDGSRFLVKNWAVTTGGAILALSTTSKRFELAVIGSVVVLVFAYIEAIYMYIQDQVIARCNQIERLLDATARDEMTGDYRFGVSQAFEGRLHFTGVVRALNGRPHIYALYVGLLAILAATALTLILAR
jgi:uncharacterized membrane protein